MSGEFNAVAAELDGDESLVDVRIDQEVSIHAHDVIVSQGIKQPIVRKQVSEKHARGSVEAAVPTLPLLLTSFVFSVSSISIEPRHRKKKRYISLREERGEGMCSLLALWSLGGLWF